MGSEPSHHPARYLGAALITITALITTGSLVISVQDLRAGHAATHSSPSVMSFLA